MTSQKRSASAFAVKELLLVLAILAVLFLFASFKITHYSKNKKPAYCVNNLKNIGISARLFAENHNDLFPWQTPENQSHISSNRIDLLFLSFSNELSTPKLLACGSDTRTAATNWSNFTRSNISYFIGLTSVTSNPASFLAGDRNILINSNLVSSGRFHIKPSATLSWDHTQHQDQGNIVLADGSIQQCSNARLNEQFNKSTGTNISTLLFP